MIAADREQWKTYVKALCATRQEEDRFVGNAETSRSSALARLLHAVNYM